MPNVCTILLATPQPLSPSPFAADTLARYLMQQGFNVQSTHAGSGWTQTPDFSLLSINTLESDCHQPVMKLSERLYKERALLLFNLQRRHGSFPMFGAQLAQYAHICGANVSALVSLPDEHALAHICRKDMDGHLRPLPVFTSPEAFLASCATRAVS